MSHIHDKIDFTVEVFIVYQNKVLLRKHDKYNIWLSIGGHIELNEDPNQAAIREVKEEVGLEIKLFCQHQNPNHKIDNYQELIPPCFMNRHQISKDHEHITLVYFAHSTSDKLTQTVKEETSKDCRWFTKEGLLNQLDIKDHIRHYALIALEKLSIS